MRLSSGHLPPLLPSRYEASYRIFCERCSELRTPEALADVKRDTSRITLREENTGGGNVANQIHAISQ